MTTKDQPQPKEEAAEAAASGLKQQQQQKQQHLQESQSHQRQPKGVALSSHEAVSRMMMMNSSSPALLSSFDQQRRRRRRRSPSHSASPRDAVLQRRVDDDSSSNSSTSSTDSASSSSGFSDIGGRIVLGARANALPRREYRGTSSQDIAATTNHDSTNANTSTLLGSKLTSQSTKLRMAAAPRQAAIPSTSYATHPRQTSRSIYHPLTTTSATAGGTIVSSHQRSLSEATRLAPPRSCTSSPCLRQTAEQLSRKSKQRKPHSQSQPQYLQLPAQRNRLGLMTMTMSSLSVSPSSSSTMMARHTGGRQQQPRRQGNLQNAAPAHNATFPVVQRNHKYPQERHQGGNLGKNAAASAAMMEAHAQAQARQPQATLATSAPSSIPSSPSSAVNHHAPGGTGFDLARLSQRSDSRTVKKTIAIVAERCEQDRAPLLNITAPPVHELELIEHWAQDSFYRIVMAKNDLIAVLVRTMRTFAAHPKVQALSCEILHSLLDKQKRNQETFQKLGGIRQVIACLDVQSKGRVQAAACAVLQCMDVQSPSSTPAGGATTTTDTAARPETMDTSFNFAVSPQA
eukprot:CAMPEP_0119556998 /NCGR_PEP_ID=MMETSP1352-20130426/8785_1 /TAXON_ID=265584 /ORGANISM="Stauroneis constricta, Strain CCMP1120" /LENGTH=571 /DNA_ID=CAMNT_0007604025 /DNA_START=65 /DNA_END=1780 /DNA_ORIENTATION=+